MFDNGITKPQLNAAQAEAVAHGAGPLLIVAGAGTGKTNTLACRVADLIWRGTSPDRILLLHVHAPCRCQMLARVARLVSPEWAGAVWGGTFHSTGLRLLRIYGGTLGLTPGFTLMDPSDAAELMNLVRNDLDIGRSARRSPQKDTLAAIYSPVANSGTELKRVLEDSYPWVRL